MDDVRERSCDPWGMAVIPADEGGGAVVAETNVVVTTL